VVDDGRRNLRRQDRRAAGARSLRAARKREIRRGREIDRAVRNRSRAEGTGVTDYWKTGHSYIKRRTAELRRAGGLRESGHYFFNPPIGRGYDDGIVPAIAVLEMLDRAGGKKMSELSRAAEDLGLAHHGALSVPTIANMPWSMR
jgi:hypothetical protein